MSNICSRSSSMMVVSADDIGLIVLHFYFKQDQSRRPLLNNCHKRIKCQIRWHNPYYKLTQMNSIGRLAISKLFIDLHVLELLQISRGLSSGYGVIFYGMLNTLIHSKICTRSVLESKWLHISAYNNDCSQDWGLGLGGNL